MTRFTRGMGVGTVGVGCPAGSLTPIICAPPRTGLGSGPISPTSRRAPAVDDYRSGRRVDCQASRSHRPSLRTYTSKKRIVKASS